MEQNLIIRYDDDIDIDVNVTEWHTGDVPRILSDFDSSSRSTNGYIGGGRCLNTLRCYGLRDGAVVALTSRQMTLSSTTSSVFSNSLNRRLPLPRTVSKAAGELSMVCEQQQSSFAMKNNKCEWHMKTIGRLPEDKSPSCWPPMIANSIMIYYQ